MLISKKSLEFYFACLSMSGRATILFVENLVDPKFHNLYCIVLFLVVMNRSLNCYSDGETFISADDLRVNLWNLEISNQSFNIVDVKPTNMEDLTGMLLLLFC